MQAFGSSLSDQYMSLNYLKIWDCCPHKQYSDDEKKEMAERKNSYYVSLVKEIDQSALIGNS